MSYIGYEHLKIAKLNSVVSSNKKSIIRFIDKQDEIIGRCMTRRDANIKRKIKELDIHCEEDFYIQMFRYDKVNYDIAVQCYDNEKALRLRLEGEILVMREMLIQEVNKNSKLLKRIENIS